MAVIIITIQYLGNAVQPVQHGLIVDEQRFGCPGRITVGRIIGGKGVHQIGVVFPVMALQVLQAGGDIIFSGFPGRYVLLVPDDSAYHKRQCGEIIHHRSGSLDSRSVLRYRTGRILHTGCQRRICSYG